jgi:hypothetical protein
MLPGGASPGVQSCGRIRSASLPCRWWFTMASESRVPATNKGSTLDPGAPS